MRYKRILLTGILSGLFFSVNAQEKPFVIQGTITGKPDGYLYLSYQNVQNKMVTDSAAIENGKFSFTGKVSEVVQAYIMTDKRPASPDQYLSLLLSAGKQRLDIQSDSILNGVLSGSPVAAEVNQLAALRAETMKLYVKLIKDYQAASHAYTEAVKEKVSEITLRSLKDTLAKTKNVMGLFQSQLQIVDRSFMDKNPQGFVTASLLKDYARQMPVDETTMRYSKLLPEVAISSMGQAIKKQIETLKGGSPGAIAFDFSATELRGDTLALHDYKGRYVLLDFWASWCAPCRQGNPHLLSLYSKYKEKGLEIIGISDDDGKPDAWKKAIEQDKIAVWKHVMRGLKKTADGDFDRRESISDRYAIQSLPTKVLIDPKGVIIGRFGGGGQSDPEMDKKLAEIFN